MEAEGIVISREGAMPDGCGRLAAYSSSVYGLPWIDSVASEPGIGFFQVGYQGT